MNACHFTITFFFFFGENTNNEIFFFFTGRKSPFLVCGKYLTTSMINRFNVIAATEILKANKPNRDEWICYNDFIRDF